MNKEAFFKELSDLRKKFPISGVVEMGNTNCDYGDNIFNSKDCYYVFSSNEMDSCLYTEEGFKEINDVDCKIGLTGNGNCECLDFVDSSDCYYSQSFARCYNIYYSWYLLDCHDCFGCTNLSNKAYCIFNVQHTEEEYRNRLPELKKLSHQEALAKRLEVLKKFPQLHSEHVDNENSEYCDYAYFLQNCYYCFDCANDQDCGYLTLSYETKDSWECDDVVRGQHLLECTSAGDLYNCYRTTDCSRCYDSFFLEDCYDCHNCFGCNKLSNKQYCILNVQYTKEEYEKKVVELRDMLNLHYSAS